MNKKESRKYILVAEDDPFYARIYHFKLKKEGYEVVVVGDGEELLKKARERRPDIILTDLVMPVMNGFEVLVELSKDSVLKDVPVIVFSSLGQEGDIERAKKFGADDYFIKTDVSIHELVEKVKKYTE